MHVKLPKNWIKEGEKDNWLEFFAEKSKDCNVYNLYFIEFQRCVYLNNVAKIGSIINQKYKTEYKFQGVFYCDFDRNPALNISALAEKMPISTLFTTKIECRNKAAIDFEEYAYLHPDFLIFVKWNAIYQPKHEKFVTWGLITGSCFNEHKSRLFYELANNYNLDEDDVYVDNIEIKQKISDDTIIKLRMSDPKKNFSCITCIESKRDEVYEILDGIYSKHQLPGSKLCEGSKDFSWKKDVPELILEDYNSRKNIPSTQTDSPALEQNMQKLGLN